MEPKGSASGIQGFRRIELNRKTGTERHLRPLETFRGLLLHPKCKTNSWLLPWVLWRVPLKSKDWKTLHYPFNFW